MVWERVKSFVEKLLLWLKSWTLHVRDSEMQTELECTGTQEQKSGVIGIMLNTSGSASGNLGCARGTQRLPYVGSMRMGMDQGVESVVRSEWEHTHESVNMGHAHKAQ
ncbi:hypothetical protein VNO78_32448 [Psophocarpus tetragonolobus]|uniref:Uncharacterized protein n=1 Tax=Psophocarpus tetragonolobus TaxID=3891 RepID=A0AAN9NVR5_PSOTE